MAAQSNVEKVRVFLVEDYNLVRLGLKAALAKFPVVDLVGEAVSGEQALERLKHMEVDVVLMDLGLPGIDGIETTQKLKAMSPDVKVVVLTSHDSNEEVLASLSAGANAFCLKEIEVEQLVQVVETVYQGGAWLDPHIAEVALQVFSNATVMPQADAAAKTENDYQLSPREQQVLQHIVDGRSNTEIAADLGVSVHTIKAQVSHVLEKLAVSDRIQAAVKAVREQLVATSQSPNS